MLADTNRVIRPGKLGHPTRLRISRTDLRGASLWPSSTREYGSCKGDAASFTNDDALFEAIWSYEAPHPKLAAISAYLSFEYSQLTLHIEEHRASRQEQPKAHTRGPRRGGDLPAGRPVCSYIAITNDQMPTRQITATSTTLLLSYGIGSCVGPVVAAIVMDRIGPNGLFYTNTGFLHDLDQTLLPPPTWALLDASADSDAPNPAQLLLDALCNTLGRILLSVPV